MSSDTSVGVVRRDPGVPARFRSLDLDTLPPPRSRKRRRPPLPGGRRLRLAFSAPLALRGDLDDDTAHAAGVLLAMANSPVSSERRDAERKVRARGGSGDVTEAARRGEEGRGLCVESGSARSAHAPEWERAGDRGVSPLGAPCRRPVARPAPFHASSWAEDETDHRL